MVVDPTRICQILVGLPDVIILGVEQPPDGVLVIHFRSELDSRDCPSCGRSGWVKDRRVVEIIDLPAFGRPVRLAWHKTRHRCPHDDCAQGLVDRA